MRIYALCIMALIAFMDPVPAISAEAEKVEYIPQTELKFGKKFPQERKAMYRELFSWLQENVDVCDLEKVEHPQVFYGPAGVEKMTEAQLALVTQMQKQLYEDITFVQHIAGMIEYDDADVKNPIVLPTEVGGVGIKTNKSVELLPIPYGGRLRLRTEGNHSLQKAQLALSPEREQVLNGTYALPDWVRFIPHLFEFHIHTDPHNERKGKVCSPSYLLKYVENENQELEERHMYDLGKAINSIVAGVPHNHFVFAKLPSRTFSVVYFGSDIDTEGNWFVAVVPLENVSY